MAVSGQLSSSAASPAVCAVLHDTFGASLLSQTTTMCGKPFRRVLQRRTDTTRHTTRGRIVARCRWCSIGFQRLPLRCTAQRTKSNARCVRLSTPKESWLTNCVSWRPCREPQPKRSPANRYQQMPRSKSLLASSRTPPIFCAQPRPQKPNSTSLPRTPVVPSKKKRLIVVHKPLFGHEQRACNTSQHAPGALRALDSGPTASVGCLVCDTIESG